MKSLSICFSTLLFALLTSASLDNVHLVRDDNHRYLPRGDVVIPPACYTRKTPPGRVSHSKSRSYASTRTAEYESSFTSSAFEGSSSSEIPRETTSAISSSQRSSSDSSEILDFDTARSSSSSRTSSSLSSATGAARGEARSSANLKPNYATAINAEPSANNAVIVNSLPTVTANDAIVVNSVPTPISQGTKAKRSSHRSHERPDEVIHLGDSDSITIVKSIETSYVPFDWTRWNDLCKVTGGRRFALGDELGCSSWKGFDGSYALDADAEPCLQQRFSDIMITYAKRHGGKHRKAWIKEVLKYRRHPRKVVKVLGVYPSTPYCLEKPHNRELVGVWNSQLKGVDFGIYGSPNNDLKAFGDEATCPYGYRSEPESCGCVLEIDFEEHKKSYSNDSGHELNGVADCLQKCTSKYRPFK